MPGTRKSSKKRKAEEEAARDPTPPPADEPEPEPVAENEQESDGEPEEGTSTGTSTATKDKEKRIVRPSILTFEQEKAVADWIKDNPMFYDKGLSDFKLREKKNAMWQAKAVELGVESGKHLQKWYDSTRTKVGKLFKPKSGAPFRALTDRDKHTKETFGFLVAHICRIGGATATSVSTIIIPHLATTNPP